MSDQRGVFFIMGNTFSLWSSFQESKEREIAGFFIRYISDRGFVEIAVSVEAPVVREFEKYLEKFSDLRITQINGDPTPQALWLGHWTHFIVKYKNSDVPLIAPPTLSPSEKFLRKILSGEVFNKPTRGRK
jgi:hypothetical protein